MLKRIKLFVQKKIVAYGLPLVKKEPDVLKWGIIGLGNMAQVLSATIHGNKVAVLEAVASRSIEKAQSFASRNGKCKAYGGYLEMVNDRNLNLDVVYIATPVKQHYQIIKDCLEAKRNVLCEKPITSNLKQFEELIQIAKQNDCFLMEGMWMKCLPTFKKAFEWIDAGKIGKIELIKADFYKKQQINPKDTIFNANEGGGVLSDYGVYAISFMTTFLKGIPERMLFSKRISSFGIDSDWQISAQKEKKRAFINISSNFSSQSKAAIIGEKGSIEWSSQFNRTNKISLFNSNGHKIEECVYKYKYQGFEYEVEEVTRCLKNNKKQSILVSLKESFDTLTVIDQLKIEQPNNNL
ncbi:Gfo/Idh/MocA family protein [Polaribacter sp. P097]|uniref:Gfo/Idh/MocA family protein n=1 Tax=Polaribacter sp. P097 TaxID=3117398 RepID=UPI002FE052E8